MQNKINTKQQKKYLFHTMGGLIEISSRQSYIAGVNKRTEQERVGVRSKISHRHHHQPINIPITGVQTFLIITHKENGP
jgi:hypothetical protein